MQTRTPFLVLIVTFGAWASLTPRVFAQCAATWEDAIGAPGVDSTVWSLLTVNDASAVGPALYVGGQFSSAGGSAAKNIAQWDGDAWSPLGTGAENGGIVYAMAAREGVLYVGGAFGNMGGLPGTKRIAKWNGSAWSDVGGGMSENNAGIRALVFFNDALYAGGYLNEIGGITAHKLAWWNGAAWSALPGDPLSSTDSVSALAVYDDGAGAALYVGGTFPSAGGDGFARNIFRWNGTALAPLGRGTNDVVESLLAWNGALYAGGHFNRVYQADGTEVVADKIARWDGANWQALGSGMNPVASYHVWALAAFDDGSGERLYAGGSFTTAGGVTVHNLTQWNGTNWSNIDSANLNGYVYALATSTYDGGLYLGGTFTTSGSPSGNRIMRWGRPLPHSPVSATASPAEIVAGETSQLSAAASDTVYWFTEACGGMLLDIGNPIAVTPLQTTTYYARTFDGVCWSYACADVAVTVNCAPPTITQQPVGGAICTDHAHQLCIGAQGAGVLHYQWKRNDLSLIGATSSCYTATQPGIYTCVVTDDCAPRVSADAAVTLTDPATGDLDGDGGVTWSDFSILVSCLSGPDVGAACNCTDADSDTDIDLADFLVVQTHVSN